MTSEGTESWRHDDIRDTAFWWRSSYWQRHLDRLHIRDPLRFENGEELEVQPPATCISCSTKLSRYRKREEVRCSACYRAFVDESLRPKVPPLKKRKKKMKPGDARAAKLLAEGLEGSLALIEKRGPGRPRLNPLGTGTVTYHDKLKLKHELYRDALRHIAKHSTDPEAVDLARHVLGLWEEL